MLHRIRAILTALLVAGIWPVTVATQRSETVAVRGQVVAAEDGAPLANARILHNLRPIGWTDASGRFDVVLARESSPLQVEKAGFVSQTVSRTGVDLVVRMVEAAMLTLRVVNARGEPVPWRAFRVSGPAGGVIGRVDERGEQRLAGLVAGRYAADLEDFLPPEPANQTTLAEQLSRSTAARRSTNNARRSGLELRAGESGAITLTVPATAVTTRGPATDGGTIRGRVSDPDDTAVRDAHVWLLGALTEMRTATDTAGAYSFESVPPGEYRVHAEAPGFVPREFAQEISGLPGRQLVLAPGETLDRIDVRLVRGGTVGGRVLDARGEPYERLSVLLVERGVARGSDRQEILVVGSDSTDERGQFRISGIDPGSYHLVVRPRGRSEGPVFHPGRLSIADATRVTVSAGVELTGMDISIDAEQGASITGIVLDPNGKPMRSGEVTLERAGWVIEPLLVRHVPIGKDGAYAFLSVAPGEYALWVGPQLVVSIRIEFGTGFPSRPAARVPTGGRTLVVGEAGSIPVEIRSSLKASLSGRLIPEGNDALPDTSSFELVAERGGARAVVRDDGTFDFFDLEGTTRFALAAGPRGWWLKSLMVRGVNVAEVPARFEGVSGSLHGVAAVVSRTGAISGRVLDENDQPAAHSSVVAFPIDQQKWTSGSPYIRSAPTDDAGAFSLEAPPGEYFLAAVRGRADTGERALARLAPGAPRVVVGAGGTVNQDIRIAP